MITTTVRAQLVFEAKRLDAKYFSSSGIRAAEVVDSLRARGLSIHTVGGANGLGSVFHPNRFKRQLAAKAEKSVPFLRAFDVFDYLPQAADLISVDRTSKIESLKVSKGTILLTRSGRNLGPAVMVDDYLARFIPSDDLLRVRIEDEQMRNYVLACLCTPTGQSLLTRNKTGAVIDHLSAADVSAVELPVLGDDVVSAIATAMQKAIDLRESARLRLENEILEYGATLPDIERSKPLKAGWSSRAANLNGRLDAAPNDPLVLALRATVEEAGGQRCGDVATAFIPGRYTRYYVAPEYGRPIVSGRQLLQFSPINLRYIAPRSFDYATYELHENMVAFGAEGRAEERLGSPTLITSDRSGWLANNHVVRIVPRDGVPPGWLFLAFAISQTLTQVKAYACGSVVDSVSPSDIEEIMLPPVDVERSERAQLAWHEFMLANELEGAAIADLEARLQIDAMAKVG